MSKKIGNLKGEPGKQADTPVIPWPRGGGSGVIVQDEGANLNSGKIVSAVDFEGAGVTAVMSGTKAVVTIPGSQNGGGVTVTQSDTDPGAIGAGNLWLQTNPAGNETYQLYVRDADDNNWLQAGTGTVGLTGPAVSQDAFIRTDTGPTDFVGIAASGSNVEARIRAVPTGGLTTADVHVSGTEVGARWFGETHSATAVLDDTGIAITSDNPITIDGVVAMPSLPTSDPHIVGRLYTLVGVVKISAG